MNQLSCEPRATDAFNCRHLIGFCGRARRTVLVAVAVCATAGFPSATAGGASLLAVSQKGHTCEGKLEAKSANVCWLMGRDGQLSPVEIKAIESVRTIAPHFREYTAAELRDQLRREMPKPFRVEGVGRFLVCAEKNNRRFGEICEDTYRTFHRYFTVRGFKITEPQFPLVIIVFPDRQSFAEYCHKDGINPPKGMLGYYMRLTNRVALFDAGEGSPVASASNFQDRGPSFDSIFTPGGESQPGFLSPGHFAAAQTQPRFDAIVEANLQNTIVHETTHQAAFNTGLHSRIGETPKWVIEGLATMFEAPGIRDSRKNTSPKSRINRDRFVWFLNYLKARRQPGSLVDFVATDDLYTSAVLDGYAEGWALTFFLAETRHASYARYLKSMATRDAMKPYRAQERLADFKRSFGDPSSLEVEYLRFYEKLK